MNHLRRGRLPRTRAGIAALVVAITAVTLFVVALGFGQAWTGAFYSNQQPIAANVSAARIFRGDRDTNAFAVTDTSSGSASDGSYSLAFASDSRYFTTVAWPAAFDTARYIEVDLNAPLPGGLATSSVSLALRFAGDSGSASTCVYVELRRISTGALLSSHGSSGSPLACASGTSYASSSPSLTAVTTSDLANDLRLRIYGRDSGATGPIRLDQVAITGSTPYASFTLYPILTRDVHDGRTDLIRWALAGN